MCADLRSEGVLTSNLWPSIQCHATLSSRALVMNQCVALFSFLFVAGSLKTSSESAARSSSPGDTATQHKAISFVGVGNRAEAEMGCMMHKPCMHAFTTFHTAAVCLHEVALDSVGLARSHGTDSSAQATIETSHTDTCLMQHDPDVVWPWIRCKLSNW